MPLSGRILLNIASEEQKPLEDFFAAKGLKTRNEMLDDVRPSPPLYPLPSPQY